MGIVPQPGGVAVSVEDDGALAVHFLQAVGVQFGLLFPARGVNAGALGFHQTEREAIIAPEDVIHVPHAAAKGHSGDGILGDVGRLRVPTRFPQHHVNDARACFRFRVVVRVGDGLIGRFVRGELRL